MEQLRTLLVVDADMRFLENFRASMEGSFHILSSPTEAETLDLLARKKIDVMLLEVNLGEGKSGLDVLRRVKESMPDFPIVIQTAQPSVESAVEAMRLGAYHYMSKSPQVEELKTLVEKALAERELKRDYELLREEVERVSGSIVGSSSSMLRVFESVQRVSMTDVTVLITGESGTGKELVAREIHAASKRSQRIVVFTKFNPYVQSVQFGCGIRADASEKENLVEKGIALRTGPENVADPDDDTGQKSHKVDFIGSALVVKDVYKSEYVRVRSNGGNHTFKIPVNPDRTYEYMIAGAWSEGAVYNTPELFKDYVRKTALEYNNPVVLKFGELEQK